MLVRVAMRFSFEDEQSFDEAVESFRFRVNNPQSASDRSLRGGGRDNSGAADEILDICNPLGEYTSSPANNSSSPFQEMGENN